MPKVSVIIAAYDAEAFLGAAIDSVLGQEFRDFEVLIAPDEPRDYGGFAGRDPRIRVLPGVPRRTGPGPARNRALAAARGDWIALLDADDLWSPNYLAELVPAAERAGTAFGRTSVRAEDGGELRAIPSGPVHPDCSGEATFETFSRAFASFHAVTRRSENRQWQDVFAEDVLFDLESLSLAGGLAPLCSRATYILRTRAQSATRRPAFTEGIGAAYQVLTSMIRGNRTLIGAEHQAQAGAVFDAWAQVNERYLKIKRLEPDLAYQTYVARLAQ